MSIPVRNIWWLMLYASDLGKSTDAAQLAAEDLPEDIPDLVAEILTRAVEQRQRRQLSTAFRQREAVLSCLRGRIDHLTTSRRQLLSQGQVARVASSRWRASASQLSCSTSRSSSRRKPRGWLSSSCASGPRGCRASRNGSWAECSGQHQLGRQGIQLG